MQICVQIVFTIPKIIRPYFKYHRALLGKLCLCAWETIKEFFGACLPEHNVPGAVISIQTWGNMGANFHPHLHALISKGGFTKEGTFHPLPWIDTRKMALLFRDKVFTMFIKEGKISEAIAQKISSWPHYNHNNKSPNDVTPKISRIREVREGIKIEDSIIVGGIINTDVKEKTFDVLCNVDLDIRYIDKVPEGPRP